MKEFVREYLLNQTDEEKKKWLEGIPKETQWKMAEGMPKQDTDITTGGKPIPLFDRTKDGLQHNDSDEEDSETD